MRKDIKLLEDRVRAAVKRLRDLKAQQGKLEKEVELLRRRKRKPERDAPSQTHAGTGAQAAPGAEVISDLREALEQLRQGASGPRRAD